MTSQAISVRRAASGSRQRGQTRRVAGQRGVAGQQLAHAVGRRRTARRGTDRPSLLWRLDQSLRRLRRPESVRLAFRYNTTYSPDWDTDIRGLRARDLGDVGGHLTDVAAAHGKIEAAVTAACAIEPRFIPVMIGGDHSVTAPAVRGFCAAHPDKRVGVINIDAHLDVRNSSTAPTMARPFAPF